jgi:hypothetical protein
MSNALNLPARFDGGSDSKRLLQGTILKNVDGKWTARDGTVLRDGDQFLVVGTTECIQCWQDGMPSDTITKTPGEPLPDVDEMNEKIPQDAWEKGPDGNPKPPWVHQFVAYLVRVSDGSTFTYLNGTVGARIAVGKLTSQVNTMQTLRGQNVAPIVALGTVEMVTKFGTKQRPHFEIVDWRELGGGSPELVPPPAPTPSLPPASATVKVGKPVQPVTIEEELNDSIPWLG